MRRLKLMLRRPDYIRGWLAHTEDSALDLVQQSILAASNKEQCTELLDVLKLVKSPKAAVPMLELMLESRAPRRPDDGLTSIPAMPSPASFEVAAGQGQAGRRRRGVLPRPERKGP